MRVEYAAADAVPRLLDRDIVLGMHEDAGRKLHFRIEKLTCGLRSNILPLRLALMRFSLLRCAHNGSPTTYFS